jgi:Mg-chelatase subunit ChlD
LSWSLDDPRWLLIALVGVAMAAVGWRWFRAVPAMRRVPALGARVLLALACALALAGLHANREADRVAVVGVVDLSGSVRSFADFGRDDLGQRISAQEAAWDLLTRAARDRQPDDPFGLVIFDGRVIALATPGPDDPLERNPSFTPTDGTDLPGALRLARAMLPGDAEGRIVLISDGRSTRGPLDEILADVPIDVAPITYRVESETVVESFDLPARAAANAEVDARVVLRSTGPARGTLTVLRDGRPIDLNPGSPGDGVRVDLEPGRHVVPLRFALDEGRVHRYEVVFEPDRAGDAAQTILFGDTSTTNNRASAFTITRSPGEVLLVDGSASGDGGLLARTVRAAGREVRVTAPAAFPTDLLDLEGFDLVILDDVPIDALPMGSAERLNAYARSFGGGVIFVGGRNALTAGGWRGSAVADALPVRLEIPDRVVMPEAAVIFVLDRSGSMVRPVMGSSRSQQEIANESAAGAIDTLDPGDLVGVISFSNAAQIVVPLGPNDDAEATRAAVLGISSGGGTNLAAALRTAKAELDRVQTKSKHVIVLTDGISLEPERLPVLASELRASGARVSTIAVGDDSDAEGLRIVAEQGGGVFYRVTNPSVLPQVFIRAVRVLREPAVRDTPFLPVLVEPDSPAMAGVGPVPTLGGVVLSTRRPEASTPLVTPEDEPVVAYWPVELGRTAVVATDAGEWAAAWAQTPGFNRFWTNLTAWTARAVDDTPGELRLMSRSDGADLVYEAVGEVGAPIDALDVTVNLYLPDGSVREETLRQTGPGRYEGRARDLPPGVIVGAARASVPGIADSALPPAIAGVSVRAGAEDQYLTSDEAGLARLADRTGGRIIDWAQPASLFERFESPRVIRSALWPTLLIAALVLFLVDVAMRRLAWDRWVDAARAGTLAASGPARVSTVDSLRAARTRADPTADLRPAPEPPRITTADAERERYERRVAQARQNAAAREGPAPARPTPDPRSANPAEPAPPVEESALLAAKRRARERFKDS